MFNPLYSILNQELFEKHLCNQKYVATMKSMDDFHYEGKPSCVTAKSTPFAVSKGEWDTKENTGKFMKNALYLLHYAKRYTYVWLNQCPSVKKIKPVVLAIIKLCLSEGISQSVTQSVSYTVSQLLSHSVSQSLIHSFSQSVSQSVSC